MQERFDAYVQKIVNRKVKVEKSKPVQQTEFFGAQIVEQKVRIINKSIENLNKYKEDLFKHIEDNPENKEFCEQHFTAIINFLENLEKKNPKLTDEDFRFSVPQTVPYLKTLSEKNDYLWLGIGFGVIIGLTAGFIGLFFAFTMFANPLIPFAILVTAVLVSTAIGALIGLTFGYCYKSGESPFPNNENFTWLHEAYKQFEPENPHENQNLELPVFAIS